MPVRDDLGKRMKEFYEGVPKTRLVRRMPVAIRIDGKAFHTFTRGFQKPFDPILVQTMQETTEYLCKNIQGCVFGYTQSDEITLILVDYQKLTSSAWFDYEVQKICSIAASMATMAFNKFFNYHIDHDRFRSNYDISKTYEWHDKLVQAAEKGAMFDARCFNIPKEEVTNLVYWRQLDAIRNSIQMVGQANFSQKQLHGKSCNMIKEMLLENNINWEDYPIYCQRGTAVIYEDGVWQIDSNMPILKDNREYLDKRVYVGEN
jgi:tRNA(His) 5'-end guanylyltransferase